MTFSLLFPILIDGTPVNDIAIRESRVSLTSGVFSRVDVLK